MHTYRVGAAAALTGVLVLLTGCNGDSGVTAQGPLTTGPNTSAPAVPASEPTGASATAGSPAASPEEAAILSQYRAFFHALTPASKLAEGPRYELMQTLAVDPELRRVMGGMAASDAAGEVGYGEDIVRPTLASVDGNTAALTDCQDGSGAGRVRAATGEKTTVGGTHDFVKVTMKRGADGIWRVATVEYQPEASCSAAS